MSGSHGRYIVERSVMDLATLEILFKYGFNYGVPTFILIALGYGIARACGFFAPEVRGLFQVAREVGTEHVVYLKANTKAVQELQTNIAASNEHHSKTHEALLIIAPEDKREDVRRIVSRSE